MAGGSYFDVDPDVRRARTPPPEAYRDPATFEALRTRVLRRGWHVVASLGDLPGADRERAGVLPATLLPGLLDEPLCAVRGLDGSLHGLSNTCTHRGTVVVEEAARCRALRCRYHGRQFHLDGRFLAQAGFEGAEGFPSPADDLPSFPVATWGPLLFASRDPATPLGELMAPLEDRVGFLPVDRAEPDAAGFQDYTVNAHWVLYCENYLEGLHIPYVHPALQRALDPTDYRMELLPWGTVQIGIAARAEDAFDLPAGHRDAGAAVAGYYFWVFPATMINVYPWGLSVNVVQPRARDLTVVCYMTYVWDASRRASGAGTGLPQVEGEDDAVVEAVQRGLAGSSYRGGRYAPVGEAGVHRFHRLLAGALA
jgi:choline monooxygenase